MSDPTRTGRPEGRPVETTPPPSEAIDHQSTGVLDVLDDLMILHWDPVVTAFRLLELFDDVDHVRDWIHAVIDVIDDINFGDEEDGHATVNTVPLPHVRAAVEAAGLMSPPAVCIPIDLGIVDLIQWLWRQGHVTYFCCQGGVDKPAHIIFMRSQPEAIKDLRRLATFVLGTDVLVDWTVNDCDLNHGRVPAVKVTMPPPDVAAMVDAITNGVTR